MTKRRSIVHVSQEYLISVLNLPPELEIVDARINNFEGGRIEFVLTGKGVPECEEGEYPLVTVIDSWSKKE